MSSTTISRSQRRASTSKVYDAVRRVMSPEEQPLRAIRESTATELGVDPSTLTSAVARALSRLVDEGIVERPRRGFYRAAKAEVEEAPPMNETNEIGRKLEPKTFIPAPAKPVEPISFVPPSAEEPKVVVDEPHLTEDSTTELEPQRDLAKEMVEQELVESEPEATALEPEPGEEPEPAVSVSVQQETRTRGVRGRLRTRRERRWTPEGSMGMQGMVMIILWFVAAGVVVFALNNVYGIFAAIGLAIVFWLLHIAMKPRAKRRRAATNSVPSRP